MKTLLMAAATLAVIAAPVAASAQSYGHGRDGGGRGYSNRGYDRGHGDRGGILAAGILGLVAGSVIANSNAGYGYAQPYQYEQRCAWRTQAYDAGYGQVAYRQVEVCR